jgi:hypothetical protein
MPSPPVLLTPFASDCGPEACRPPARTGCSSRRRGVVQIADDLFLLAGGVLERALVLHDRELEAGARLCLVAHRDRRVIFQRLVRAVPVDDHAVDAAGDHVVHLALDLSGIARRIAGRHVAVAAIDTIAARAAGAVRRPRRAELGLLPVACTPWGTPGASTPGSAWWGRRADPASAPLRLDSVVKEPSCTFPAPPSAFPVYRLARRVANGPFPPERRDRREAKGSFPAGCALRTTGNRSFCRNHTMR